MRNAQFRKGFALTHYNKVLTKSGSYIINIAGVPKLQIGNYELRIVNYALCIMHCALK